MSTNIFLDDFMNKNRMSQEQKKFVRLSENILDINPIPIFIKSNFKEVEEFNTEFNILIQDLTREQIYVEENQDPSKDFGIFTSKNAYVPGNNFLQMNNMYVDKIRQYILDGINEMISVVYNHQGNFRYTITNSWIQKYKQGNFLSPHNHIASVHSDFHKVFSVAYYIDDGDPDVSQTYSGCITFVHQNQLVHIRPTSGTLLIWEDYLIHLVNPFFSQSNKERFMLSANIDVELLPVLATK